MNLSPTNKSPAVKITSVTNIFSPVTDGKLKEVDPYKLPFEVGSSVSSNGRDLVCYRLRKRDSTPNFYGIIEKMTLLDNIKWGNNNILCVTSGHYKWLDKRKHNLMVTIWAYSRLIADT